MNYIDIKSRVAQPEYSTHFWNAMRGKAGAQDKIDYGRDLSSNAYLLPVPDNHKCMNALVGESAFRQMATTVEAYGNGFRINAKDCDDMAQWVPETGAFPIYDGIKDFTPYPVDSYKLGVLVKMDEDFVRDVNFDLEGHLTHRLAKNFGRAEDSAFINGNGVGMPTGILHEADGADVSVETAALTYDDVIRLYFSVKPEYRKKGVWLMNDETALMLRTLKDSAGNYLWRGSDDTILGKKVMISEFMPSVGAATKPIAFGDFSYYWVIGRSPISVRPITERFAHLNQVGYLAYEFLDGKLIRSEAVKVIAMDD